MSAALDLLTNGQKTAYRSLVKAKQNRAEGDND